MFNTQNVLSESKIYNLDFDHLPRECWANIDTNQLVENFRIIQKVAGTPVLAVVKANGYGHGYAHAARAFARAGASYLGVANLAEAHILRHYGVEIPILIICGMLPHEMREAAQAGFEFFVWRREHLDALSGVERVNVHLKIDTGMGRLGCRPEEAGALASQIATMSGVTLKGLVTHFASAYNPSLPDTDRQIGLFQQVIETLRDRGVRPEIVHAANSSGALCYPKGRFDMVRVGIALYGVPGDRIPLPEGMKTALTWKARLTHTHVLPQGHGVSYSSEYVMPEEARVGVLPVGYADGFQRVPKAVNTVLVEGQERAVLGRICMDQCLIDLKGFGDITGAEVVLIGRQGENELYVKTIAGRWGTNAHDVYCGISPRVPRRVV